MSPESDLFQGNKSKTRHVWLDQRAKSENSGQQLAKANFTIKKLRDKLGKPKFTIKKLRDKLGKPKFTIKKLRDDLCYQE